MLIRFRATQDYDFDSLTTLAQAAEIGVTTLPTDPKLIKARLEYALESFHHPLPNKSNYFWFVLENVTTHELLGVAAIANNINHTSHHYVFKRIPYEKKYEQLGIIHQDEYLLYSTDLTNCSELCTLFLHPKARGLGLGQFLSRARLLFLGQFSHLFNHTIIAEMRGIHNKLRPSPFWQAVGKKFFHMSYNKAEHLAAKQNTDFIRQLIPTKPIYLSLLPKAAQNVVGKVHPLTQPAMHILLEEGFQLSPYIDCFDAGPIIWSQLDCINTVKQHKFGNCLIQSTKFHKNSRALLANTKLATFHATQANIAKLPQENIIIIDATTALALNVKDGDKIQILDERPFSAS